MAIDNVTVKKIVIPDRFKPVLGASGFYFMMMAVFIYFAPDVFLQVGMFTAVFSLFLSLLLWVLRWYLSLYLAKSIYPFLQSWP